MQFKRVVAIIFLTASVWAVPAVVAGQDFKVVINEANTTTGIDKEGLSKCFMRQATMWISGHDIDPVDQAPTSKVRQAFSKYVHGRDVNNIKKYWQRQIYSGQGVPPQELASDQAVLDFVRAHPGGVGYVSLTANIGNGVKVLEITGD